MKFVYTSTFFCAYSQLGAPGWIRDIAQLTAPKQVEAYSKGQKLIAFAAYFLTIAN